MVDGNYSCNPRLSISLFIPNKDFSSPQYIHSRASRFGGFSFILFLHVFTGGTLDYLAELQTLINLGGKPQKSVLYLCTCTIRSGDRVFGGILY
jgi:hypothetical protein